MSKLSHFLTPQMNRKDATHAIAQLIQNINHVDFQGQSEGQDSTTQSIL